MSCSIEGRMMRPVWLIALVGTSATALRVQAQQLVVDETYTATTANTTDSHFFVKPPPGAPVNWHSPVDYGNGTAYVRLEILSKPSAKKTFYNICFEGNSGTCCMPLSPLYTAPGVVTFSAQLPSIWNYSTVDWIKGVHQIALILKDENQAKVQGDPAFYPTTIHVTITIVPPGGTYVPPTDAKDAGTPKDASTPRAKDASVGAHDAAIGPVAAPDAGSRTSKTADASTKSGAGGAAVTPAANAGASSLVDGGLAGNSVGATSGGAGTTTPTGQSPAGTGQARAGCSIVSTRSTEAPAAIWSASGLLLLARSRRRRTRTQR